MACSQSYGVIRPHAASWRVGSRMRPRSRCLSQSINQGNYLERKALAYNLTVVSLEKASSRKKVTVRKNGHQIKDASAGTINSYYRIQLTFYTM